MLLSVSVSYRPITTDMPQSTRYLGPLGALKQVVSLPGVTIILFPSIMVG